MEQSLITIVYNTSAYVEKFRLSLIYSLQRAGYHVVVIAPLDEATPRLIDLGISIRLIEMKARAMNPLTELWSILKIRSILKELRPVASLHYTIKPNIFGSLAAHSLGIPVLNNIAGAGHAFSGRNFALRALVILLYRLSLKESHTVFFQNNDDMEVFIDAGVVRKEQCVRIPGSGVDLTRLRPSPIQTGPVRFLFVGRLLKQKGIQEFLDAANQLLSETQNRIHLCFDIAGELENGRSCISKTALEWRTQAPQISYHGALPTHQVLALMRQSTCVVLPSYYGEGVPRVLLEACALGRPIITTDNVGCRDVVEPGFNGWMVPVRDVNALVVAMRSCAENSLERLQELGSSARTVAENRFDERIVVDAYLSRLSLLAET